MIKAVGRFGVACWAVGFLVTSASAQPTMSLKAVKRGNTNICPPSNSITASPFEVIEAEVFLSNWSISPPTRRLGSWQWALDTEGFTSGPRGSFDFVLGRRACTTNAECNDIFATCGRDCFTNADCSNLNTTCVAGRCSGWNGFCDLAPDPALGTDRAGAVFVIAPHSHVTCPTPVNDSYVLGVCTGILATDLSIPRAGATLIDLGCAPTYTAPPKYAGTIKIRASGDACGSFTIALKPPSDSQLNDTNSIAIEPLTLEGLTINLGTCACTTIVSSQPADCSIDPKQPSEPDGSNPAGPTSIVVTMDCDTGAPPVLTCANFLVSQVPSGAPALSCQSVTPRFGGINEQILVNFNRRVTTQRWNCLEYQAGGKVQGQRVCFNHFPGDVNQSRAVEPILDVNRLLDCLDGDFPCTLAECDVDRTGLCASKDLLRLGDLENGGENYPVYRGLTILECPP